MYDGEPREFNNTERASLKILHNRIYRHKVMRVNYTTYDMRRDQDSINPRTHPDIMVLAHEDHDENSAKFHPYWYARVVGIFHAIVKYSGPGASADAGWESKEFLWVRWFGRELEAPGGFRTRRLHRIGFVDEDPTAEYEFLDPQNVIRAVHLIPAFDLADSQEGEGGEHGSFYVNMYVLRAAALFCAYVPAGFQIATCSCAIWAVALAINPHKAWRVPTTQ